ncbi:MAG: hypothetical protein CVT49_09665 [candidate division Zixibacteria bacterium HGW-Zixibacteria-1]|nr:MAG: hypothetical protein CVT49_09665 [candidate division Zixibacteria bacterium HGW-Zixibacteria-1]
MYIEIDLVSNWLELKLEQISQLISNGFEFENYDEWKAKKIKFLNNQKDGLLINKQSIQAESTQSDDSILRKKYQMDLVCSFINLHRRFVKPKRRAIKCSREFICPEPLRNGLKLLKKKISNGDSLLAHMSKGIFNATEHDGMFYDWGIHHLHLGVKPDEKLKKLIERTSELLYAIFDNEYAYFIIIGEHKQWADKNIMRIVKNNFPQIINTSRFHGFSELSYTPSEKETINLRKSLINVILDLNGEYYAVPGGGVSCGGLSVRSVEEFGRIIRFYKNAEDLIKNQMEQNSAILFKQMSWTYPIRLEMLTLADDNVTVVDKMNKFRLTLIYNQKSNKFTDIYIKSI